MTFPFAARAQSAPRPQRTTRTPVGDALRRARRPAGELRDLSPQRSELLGRRRHGRRMGRCPHGAWRRAWRVAPRRRGRDPAGDDDQRRESDCTRSPKPAAAFVKLGVGIMSYHSTDGEQSLVGAVARAAGGLRLRLPRQTALHRRALRDARSGIQQRALSRRSEGYGRVADEARAVRSWRGGAPMSRALRFGLTRRQHCPRGRRVRQRRGCVSDAARRDRPLARVRPLDAGT